MSIWWALTEGSHKNLSVLLLSLTIVPFPCAFQAHNENTEKTNRKSLKQSPDCRPFDLAYDTIDRAFSKASEPQILKAYKDITCASRTMKIRVKN